MTAVVSNREEDSMNNEPSLSGRAIIGLIYPPPDIRTIVDKTARFAAKNGVDFENKIREKEAKNPKFNFLSITDPYHAYYKKMVYDFSEGRVEAPKVPQAVKEHVKKAEFVPSAPPPAYEFSADPSTINAYDLDLIRLVALFVARNGRQFLTQLMTREARNYQFDFLKPAHCNFTYFTKLVDQYQKVLVPSTNIVAQLQDDATNKKRLIEDINYRVSWEKHQKGLKDREEAEAEKERQAYASIDWHDFVVVQTVDFQPGDTSQLPPLCTPKDVGARILLEARNEMQKAAAEMQEMDMEESDSDDEDAVQAPEAPAFTAPLPPTKQKDVIVRDYDPKRNVTQKPKAVENWIISPLTGERIPSDKLAEHVRYNTVDSQYKEDRDRHIGERSTEEPVLALGADISRNLGNFAERRTDIFGIGGEQTMIGKKLGEEDNSQQGQNKLIWDGTEETRDMITRAVQNQVTLDQQINEIHRQHGFVADPSKEKIGAHQVPRHQTTQGNVTITQGITTNIPGQMPPGWPPVPPMGMPGMPPNQALPPIRQMDFGGPPAKRARTEDDLIPEADWLKKVNGALMLNVQLPQAPEHGMDGSIVQFSIQVTAPLSELKQQIQDRYGMPVGKQKLMSDGLFVKDNMSSAFYNLADRTTIHLQVKERGGKKK